MYCISFGLVLLVIYLKPGVVKWTKLPWVKKCSVRDGTLSEVKGVGKGLQMVGWLIHRLDAPLRRMVGAIVQHVAGEESLGVIGQFICLLQVKRSRLQRF